MQSIRASSQDAVVSAETELSKMSLHQDSWTQLSYCNGFSISQTCPPCSKQRLVFWLWKTAINVNHDLKSITPGGQCLDLENSKYDMTDGKRLPLLLMQPQQQLLCCQDIHGATRARLEVNISRWDETHIAMKGFLLYRRTWASNPGTSMKVRPAFQILGLKTCHEYVIKNKYHFPYLPQTSPVREYPMLKACPCWQLGFLYFYALCLWRLPHCHSAPEKPHSHHTPVRCQFSLPGLLCLQSKKPNKQLLPYI